MSGDVSEAELIRRAAAGDQDCLAQLLLMHYDELEQYVAGRLSAGLDGVARAEDIVQQTLVRAVQHIGAFQLRREGALQAWLKTIAANLIRDARKRQRRERRAEPAAWAGQSGRSLLQQLARDSGTPSRMVQREESMARLHTALAGLPDDERQVVRRHYLYGESFEQIARTMGRSRDAIRGLCYRGRKRLRVLMGRSSCYFSG